MRQFLSCWVLNFTVIYFLFFLGHFGVLKFLNSSLFEFNLLISYFFNFLFSLIIIRVLIKNILSLSPQTGFIFMFLSGLKFFVFFVFFYPIFKQDGVIQVIEKTTFLIPYFIGLLLEIYIVGFKTKN